MSGKANYKKKIVDLPYQISLKHGRTSIICGLGIEAQRLEWNRERIKDFCVYGKLTCDRNNVQIL